MDAQLTADAEARPGLRLMMRAMACNNAWANHRLLRACSLLTDEEFSAPRIGFFPSLRATLNHILTVDWFYVDACERSLAGKPINERAAGFFDPAEPCADCASLSLEQHAVDGRLVALCDALQEPDFERTIALPRGEHVQRERLDRVLAHLFQHQVHHRGQAHAMLSGTRIAPPQLDEFFAAEEAPLRAGDLLELGYDEPWIWGPADRQA
jgi:uncharacterized damage-inducible protein DinB